MRVALITGASGGLGSNIARVLAEEGYALVLHYNTNPTRIQDILKKFPQRTISVQADLCSEQQVRSMASCIKDSFGRLDLLINNAAVTIDKLLLRLDEKDWDRVMAVNLTGAFLVIKHCLGLMSEGSHIINILSRSGLKGRAGQTAYSASKAALWGMTKSLARELAHQGIRVNAIVPGYLPTGMGLKAPKAMERAKVDSVFGLLGNPEDVVITITLLEQMKTVSGQIIVVDSRI